MAAKHISLGATRDAKLQQELRAKKAEAEKTGDLREYVSLLEDEHANLQKKIDEVNSALHDEEHARMEEQARREEEADQHRYQLDSLKSQLEQSRNGRRDVGGVDDERVRQSILALIEASATVEQCLLAAETLFSDRFVVLPSAFKSARESDDFRDPHRAFDLLLKLAVYAAELQSGKPDTQARAVLGNCYAARESYTVESNKRAGKLRSFDYKGVPVEMHQHVKIGVKDSAAETLRIHFAWDSNERKLIVGHCGPHLPFK
ncbi:MAG: hypothetical protein ACYC7A_19525 [Thermoanaerobaculia bacterium]